MSNQNSPAFSQIEWVAPHSDLAALVHTFFILRTRDAQLEDMMPSYSAQLFSFVEGSGEIHYPDRSIGQSGDLTLNAPMLRAAPMVLKGPVVNVGASFTPLGWASFCNQPVDKVHDCAFEVDDVIEARLLEPVKEALARCRSGAISAAEYCDAIQQMILDVCAASKRPVPEDHRVMTETIDQWLESAFSPSVKDLYAQLDLGQRQVQRLCRRYYGVPPAQLVKRSRAIRAAMLLAHEELSEELRDEVLGAYFDQAHLIHDIRRYTGRTPKRLSKDAMAQDLLDPDGHGRPGKTVRKG